MGKTQRLEFQGASGAKLAARLEWPAGKPRAYAVFAHCFTCSKDIFAARRITNELTQHDLAVMRFDFTGLGQSDGDFAHTNFSSDVADLKAAIAYLTEHFEAPKLLIGHSLGGAAVLSAASECEGVEAVATIGAPSSTDHVLHMFAHKIDEIEKSGATEVHLAGRTFTITAQFLKDMRAHALEDKIKNLDAALLVLHAPGDETVGIENASAIFGAAKHPKSFVSLDTADHLLTKHVDADYAACVIGAWATRFIGEKPDIKFGKGHVIAAESGEGKFHTLIKAGEHTLVADEPPNVGGDDRGPTPVDLVAAGLGACTTMTVRMYLVRKGWQVGQVSTEIAHEKIKSESDPKSDSKGIDQFTRTLTLKDHQLDAAQMERVLQIANKCPVHRMLENEARIVTQIT